MRKEGPSPREPSSQEERVSHWRDEEERPQGRDGEPAGEMNKKPCQKPVSRGKKQKTKMHENISYKHD